jgi:formylglycine-generating enzyme required for sulfatase activity
VEQRDAINKSWELFGMGDDYPVYYISWDDAQIFIEQLNRKTGKRFRMPTEAEWEYAARGGAHSANYKYSGSNDLKEVAWFDEKTNTYTHPVGAKKPNELGIYDMSGNVWEWCSDWFGKYSATNQSNPQGATVGREKVCRGGGWYTFERPFRVFYRTSNEPQTRNSALGIRLASDAPSNR